MESLYWVILATVVFLLIIKLLKYPHVKTNLPPGPPKWPLIGNLNLIGPLPHESLHKLSQTYGKLMHLTFGSSPVVVASSPDMAKLFLKTYDHIFASRPRTQAGKYTNYNSKDLIWSPFGDFWNQGRKIFLEEIFSTKKLDSFEHIRVEERNVFLSSLHKFSGEQIVLKDHIFRMTLSVICRIALGRKYFSESKDEKEIMTVEEIENMLDEFFVLNGALNLGDWLPWLKFMDVQGYAKRMKALGKRFDRFNEYVLQEHKEKMKSEGDGFVEKDIVDVLLKLAHDPNLEVKLDYDCVKAFTQDLIIGGTDTTTTTLEWAMSELIRQPHLMKMATEELDRVIGKERWVLESDFTDLPFIDAIIKETMRLHPAAVFLAPHLALEDCKVDGYDIAKNTTIFINTWSIGRDPDLWDDPESFQPKRFMGSDIDVKGHHFELLPFGSGRRMCPGYRLGMKTTRSLLGNMLQGFNWKLHESVKIEDINVEELYGLSTKRKFPLVVIPEPRLPAHMYN